jgi:serine/threonine protein kinase
LSRAFLCREEQVGNRVVVKKVSRPETIEAQTLGQLQHVGIMPIYSAETRVEDGLTVLTMPFLGRSTLLDLIDALNECTGRPTFEVVLRASRRWLQPADQLPEPREDFGRAHHKSFHDWFLLLGKRLLDALEHVHRAGILHCDIKPSNILLTPNGEPVLMDFNMSSFKHVPLARGGTLTYMSPEVLRKVALNEGESAIDERSDLFSLGVVLYEVATGHLPFPLHDLDVDVKQAAVRLLELQESGFAPITKQTSEISSTLAAVIERSMSARPEDRPTARALRGALDAEGRWWRRLCRTIPKLRWFRRTLIAIPIIIIIIGMAVAVWLLCLRSAY